MHGPMSPAVAALQDFLTGCGPGPVEDMTLVEYLASAWPYLEGSDAEGMRIAKLGRLEDPAWEPPRLTFVIERHGAMPFGSTRATRQVWTIHLEAATAAVEERGYRQVIPRAPALKVEPIVAELVRLVAAGTDDAQLRWSADRAGVRILAGKVIPDDGFKETVQGRRRRLRSRLEPALVAAGWRPGAAPWTYVRMGDTRG